MAPADPPLPLPPVPAVPPLPLLAAAPCAALPRRPGSARRASASAGAVAVPPVPDVSYLGHPGRPRCRRLRPLHPRRRCRHGRRPCFRAAAAAGFATAQPRRLPCAPRPAAAPGAAAAAVTGYHRWPPLTDAAPLAPPPSLPPPLPTVTTPAGRPRRRRCRCRQPRCCRRYRSRPGRQRFHHCPSGRIRWSASRKSPGQDDDDENRKTRSHSPSCGSFRSSITKMMSRLRPVDSGGRVAHWCRDAGHGEGHRGEHRRGHRDDGRDRGVLGVVGGGQGRIQAAIEGGGFADALVEEIGPRQCDRHRPRLELGPGGGARHAFCLSPKGNPELRKVTERGCATRPRPTRSGQYTLPAGATRICRRGRDRGRRARAAEFTAAFAVDEGAS